MLRIAAVLIAALVIPSIASAGPANPHRISITRDAVKGAFDYDSLSAQGDRACMVDGIVLVNATDAPVSLDLYEAQTDVAFPFGSIAPGGTRDVPMSRAARIVVVDAATGHPLALVSVEDCAGR